MLIPREYYLNRLRGFKDKDLIKIVTGIRRCGKSTLLKMFCEELKENGVKDENIIFINLESGKYRRIKNITDLDKVVYNSIKDLNGRIYLILDEIQNVEEWEIAVNSYMIDLNIDIYVTGSNSNIMSRELATKLTGRYIRINLYPLSFKEYYDYNKTDTKQVALEKEILFREFYKYGGFPKLNDLEDEEKLIYLIDVYTSILNNDVIGKNKIKNTPMLEKLIEFLIDNIGNQTSSLSISKYFKNEGITISSETIYKYLTYLTDSYLINRVFREDIKCKKKLKLNEKYYIVDPCFINTLYPKDNEISGHILENIVYMEFVKRGYNVTVGKYNGKEIDFVCRKRDKKIYVQVALTIIKRPETEEREFDPLKKIKDNYPKYVLSTDNIDLSQKGILHYNIVDFLLSDEF